MARILLVDDDAGLVDVLGLTLEDEGHAVCAARDGRDGWTRFAESAFDLVITDVNMPHLDGFTLCRRIRERSDVPILVLTSRDSDIDEVVGLELGADDWVTKPFRSRVLVARVGALLRRQQARRTSDAPQLRRRGRLELDPERMAVRVDGRPVTVTVTEFRLLDALSQRSGIVLSRSTLLERIREDDSVVAPRIIDTYVRRLRRSFEAAAEGFDPIETVIGAGYRWRDADP